MGMGTTEIGGTTCETARCKRTETPKLITASKLGAASSAVDPPARQSDARARSSLAAAPATPDAFATFVVTRAPAITAKDGVGYDDGDDTIVVLLVPKATKENKALFSQEGRKKVLFSKMHILKNDRKVFCNMCSVKEI